jgi:hypothetical protein
MDCEGKELEAAETAPVREDDLETRMAAWHAARDEEYKHLKWQASALIRSFEGWNDIGSREDWLEVLEESRDNYLSGRFLLEHMGAERYLDARQYATLLTLRRKLIEDLGIQTAQEMLLIDVAVLAYHHMLRVNTWIGNLALHVESEFFGRESPTVRVRKQHGRSAVEGLDVEGTIARLGQQMLPLLDRSSHMMLRALKAVHDLRQAPSPSVAIGQAGQVNVGAVQTNLASPGHSGT